MSRDEHPSATWWGRVSHRVAQVSRALEEFYVRPYRQTLARERRDEDDFFTLVVLGEALGVPDPAAYHSAELMPYLFDDFHAWHRRMGMPRSPLDHLSCC
ncbi:cory-CC-star protein [uncultured Tessaracoccus sp.]|uniref:cory-CC-star protein n=1 Tax=uncultured Tessaracoccus sp. TaxID=905023 RepID=UPI0025FD8031|nr:cory-CC-star protein [uncultured Tessaracoccus sp.]